MPNKDSNGIGKLVRFREKKRLNVLKYVHHVVYDSQIPGPCHENPPLVLRNQQTTIYDSHIAETSSYRAR